MSRNDHIFTKIARHSYGERITKDHSETFLINTVLTLGLGDFFLARVSG